jgi:CheY-like chemotaxis protein
MEQVVTNLLGNALKYTAPGGRMSVRVAPEDGTAVLEVADTGVGIPPGLIDKVFDLFVQGDRALDRAQGGLGIGLTLVKALVVQHRGTVTARSDGGGKGSVFTVRLPRLTAPVGGRAETASAAPAARWRILVIEDNDDGREMLRLALTVAGHEVHEAPDGRIGVELAARVAPDVALIDIGLPDLDGYEVARRIRARTGGESIVLVAVTGYGQNEDRRRALDAGFDAHVTKPVDPDRLAEVIAAGRSRV